MEKINCISRFINIEGNIAQEKTYRMPVPIPIQQIIGKHITDNNNFSPFEYVEVNNGIKIDYHMKNKADFDHMVIDNLIQASFPEQYFEYKDTLIALFKNFPQIHIITIGILYKPHDIQKVSLYLFDRDKNGKIKRQPSLAIPSNFRDLFAHETWMKIENFCNGGEIKMIGLDITHSQLVFKIYVRTTNEIIKAVLNKISTKAGKSCELLLKEYNNNGHSLILSSAKLSSSNLHGFNLYFD